jgi:hypothetical protein
MSEAVFLRAVIISVQVIVSMSLAGRLQMSRSGQHHAWSFFSNSVNAASSLLRFFASTIQRGNRLASNVFNGSAGFLGGLRLLVA